MAGSTDSAWGNWTRTIIIVLLGFIGYTLLEYAPLIPKAMVFMDDVHRIREKSAELQHTAEGIQTSLEKLEKKFSFFKQEAERKGQPWPTQ